jgi:tRNA(adenine34) deaminase
VSIAQHRWHIQHRAASPVTMMRRALVEAHRAWRMNEVPVGAVVYRGHELIATGWNLRETLDDPTAHAELIAIRRAAAALGDWRLNDCSLAVTLEPCAMCAGTIVNARVGHVIYGATDPKAGAVESLYELCADARLNHRAQVTAGVLADECGDVLRRFFQARRAARRRQT